MNPENTPTDSRRQEQILASLPPLRSSYDLLVHGLVLAVVAPTDDSLRRALQVAGECAAKLPPADVILAKKEAERLLGIEPGSNRPPRQRRSKSPDHPGGHVNGGDALAQVIAFPG